jgi:hypothetical protein
MSAKRAAESKRNSKKPRSRSSSSSKAGGKPPAKAAEKKLSKAAAKGKSATETSVKIAVARSAMPASKSPSKTPSQGNATARTNSAPAYVVRWQVRDIDLVREHPQAADARTAFATFEEARERAVDDLIDTLEHLERRLLELKRAASFEDYSVGRAAPN